MLLRFMDDEFVTRVVLEVKPAKMLEVIKSLRDMGLTNLEHPQDFIFSYNPVKSTKFGINKSTVEFKFRDPQYASFLIMKWGAK